MSRALQSRRYGIREGKPVATKRRLFVHIGLPKTGSTTIQVLAYALRGELASKGIGIARTGCRAGRCCHNALVRQLSRRSLANPRRDLWQALAGELDASSSPSLLVSAELFTAGGVFTPTPGRDSAARLAGLAADLDLDVRLIAYVRPLWQYAESLYSQLVKRGFLAERFETWLGGALRSGVLDYGRALGPWREAFGERLSVHAVDLSGSGGALVAHFFAWLGVPGSNAAEWRHAHENRRPGAKELEALRRAGAALMEKGYGLGLRKRLLGRLVGLAPLLEGDVPFAPLSATQAQELTGQFAQVNSDLATVYGVDAGDVLFREIGPREPCSAGWNDFRSAERRRVNRYVLAQTGANLERARDRSRSLPQSFWTAAAVGALRVAATRMSLYRPRWWHRAKSRRPHPMH
ncbi:MAG: hypothetical protein F4Y31_11390 [Gammaproteobacteria bacterium]|nr:hypothetical protein [Gammaproteobacteria bacterium]MYF66498.1 hypothetical protein [Gammaproteobacteria bacterium]MYK37190.1 hypothetical protein [Gammaproteobacteria bacterium]